MDEVPWNRNLLIYYEPSHGAPIRALDDSLYEGLALLESERRCVRFKLSFNNSEATYGACLSSFPSSVILLNNTACTAKSDLLIKINSQVVVKLVTTFLRTESMRWEYDWLLAVDVNNMCWLWRQREEGVLKFIPPYIELAEETTARLVSRKSGDWNDLSTSSHSR